MNAIASPAPSTAPAPAALVVYNPVSATFDRAAFEAALAASFAGGGRPCLRFETDGEDNLEERMARAIAAAAEQGCPLVLAAGGDGTVSAVADALSRVEAERRPVLGIIPLGTANVLARELEVPIDAARATALAVAGARVVDLDAIGVAGRYYLTQVGVGLDARMIARTTREEQRQSGRLAYLRALVREMSGWRSHRFELVIDGRRVRKRAWEVLVANARTMGTPPFTWGPEITPTDGVLDVGVYNVRTVLDWLRLVARFLTGRHRVDQRAHYYRVTKSIRIASKRRLPVQGDGELIAETPVELTVAPALLQVVVGPDDAAAAEAATLAAAAEAEAMPTPVVAAPAGRAATAAGDAAQAIRLTLWRRLAGMDHAVYLWVNRLHAWPPATWVARVVSRTMDHGELWVVVALAVAALDPGHDLATMLGVIAVLWLAELTVNFPIKSAFRRQRPFDLFAHADVRVTRLPRDWSFPSGHSATAFAGAALLTPFMPVAAPLLFAYAAIVALSRVYLGVHYPVDVLLGGAVGIGLAAAYAGVGRALLGLL